MESIYRGFHFPNGKKRGDFLVGRTFGVLVVFLNVSGIFAQFPDVVCLPFKELDLKRTQRVPREAVFNGTPTFGHNLSRLTFIPESSWVLGELDSYVYDPEPAPPTYWLENTRTRLFNRSARVIAVNARSREIIQLRVRLAEQYFDKGECFEFVEMFPLDSDRVAVVVAAVRNECEEISDDTPMGLHRLSRSQVSVWEWNLRSQEVFKSEMNLVEAEFAQIFNPARFEIRTETSDQDTSQIIVKSRDNNLRFDLSLDVRDELIPSTHASQFIVFRSDENGPSYGLSCYDIGEHDRPRWIFGKDKAANGVTDPEVSMQLPDDVDVRRWSVLPIYVSTSQTGKASKEELVFLNTADGNETARIDIGATEYLSRLVVSNDLSWAGIQSVRHARLVNMISQEKISVRLKMGQWLEGILDDGTLVMTNVFHESIWLGKPVNGEVTCVNENLFALMPIEE